MVVRIMEFVADEGVYVILMWHNFDSYLDKACSYFLKTFVEGEPTGI